MVRWGRSGDLVELAHIALALIGEGEVFYQGVRRPTEEVLAELSIKPRVLEPKEGLALINGTAVMTGINALLVRDAEQLLALAVRSGALAVELMNGLSDAYSEPLHAVRPHPGQKAVAASCATFSKPPSS